MRTAEIAHHSSKVLHSVLWIPLTPLPTLTLLPSVTGALTGSQ